jgi:hypothetical protein
VDFKINKPFLTPRMEHTVDLSFDLLWKWMFSALSIICLWPSQATCILGKVTQSHFHQLLSGVGGSREQWLSSWPLHPAHTRGL